MKENTVTPKKRGSILKLVILVAVVVFVISVALFFDLQRLLQNTLEWIDTAGPAGPIIFFLLYIIATVFMVPGTILTLGAGVVFGVVKGSILVSVASTAGSIAAFIVGRYLARQRIAARIEANEAFRSMDEAVSREGWKIVGLARLSPVFPFNLLNYAFSLTRISLKDYALASWIGMIPGTILYVYIGSLAGSLAKLGADQTQQGHSGAEWALYIVGLAATVVITVILTRIARRTLKARMDSHDTTKGSDKP